MNTQNTEGTWLRNVKAKVRGETIFLAAHVLRVCDRLMAGPKYTATESDNSARIQAENNEAAGG